MERQLQRDGAALHQQHPAARRRHPSCRLPGRPDADDQHLCPNLGHRQEGKGRFHRRRCARRADLRPVGKGAGSEVLVPDQGQAGQFRGSPRRRESGERKAGRMVRGKPRTGQGDCRQDRRGGAGARSSAQGARADAAQDGDGRVEPARQTCRLSGKRPCAGGIVPRRRRQRRRVGQAGARAEEPGGASLAWQDSRTWSGRGSTGCCRRTRSAR